MRAEDSKDSVRARSWQSQRVTRRSGVERDAASDGTVFQPLPSHSGQILGGALITDHLGKSLYLTLHRAAAFAQVGRVGGLRTSCEGRGWSVEASGKVR